MNYADFIQPQTTTGDYDLVLDMGYQIFGRTPSAVGGADNLTIHARNVSGFLEIYVTNPDEPNSPYNGLYYRVPAANIKSLTIRGTNDNETFLVEGTLGLKDNGPVYVEGGGGTDVLQFEDGASQDVESHYTLDVSGQAGWEAALFHAGKAAGQPTLSSRPTIYLQDVERYQLLTGAGDDTVRVNYTPAAAGFNGTEVYTRAGDDLIVVGTATAGLSNVRGPVYADAGTGATDEIWFDDGPANAANAHYTVELSGVQDWDHVLHRTVGATALSPIYFNSADRVSLHTGAQADAVRIDAAPAASVGTFVETHGGDDQIFVGIEGKGLDDILSVINVDGQGGTNTLTVDNRGGANKVLTENNTSFTRGDGKTINFTNVTKRETHASAAATVNLNEKAAGLDDKIILEGGGNAVNFGAAGTFAFALGGDPNFITVQGGADQITLAGALSVSLLAGFAADPVGTVVKIIDNQTALPIVGTFDNLPEGALVTVGNRQFTISYGGTWAGGDVTLTLAVIVPPGLPPHMATVYYTSSGGKSGSMVWNGDSYGGYAYDVSIPGYPYLRLDLSAYAVDDWWLHVHQSEDPSYIPYLFFYYTSSTSSSVTFTIDTDYFGFLEGETITFTW